MKVSNFTDTQTGHTDRFKPLLVNTIYIVYKLLP